MIKSKTVVTQLSGAGRGAVASIVVNGPSAIDYISQLFVPAARIRVSDLRKNLTYFGTWRWRNYIEELVICRTELDQIEVHCHGGSVAARNILDSLMSAGASELTIEDWLERDEADLFVRQAKQLLPNARTEKTSAILLAQVRGAMRKQLQNVLGLLELDQLDEARSRLRRVVDFRSIGLHLTSPWSVVLIGPPNAGKSSLINAVVGFDRAVVFDQPGTTRDLVTASTAIDGWPVSITDTAGIRESNNPIELEGIRRAKDVLSHADLALSVCDLNTTDRIKLPNRPLTLYVGTKLDLASATNSEYDVLTSAVTGQGIAELVQLISRSLVPKPPEPQDAVPLCQSTADLLRKCLQTMETGDRTFACKRLSELLALS